jgi:hypothetical protein
VTGDTFDYAFGVADGAGQNIIAAVVGWKKADEKLAAHAAVCRATTEKEKDYGKKNPQRYLRGCAFDETPECH